MPGIGLARPGVPRSRFRSLACLTFFIGAVGCSSPDTSVAPVASATESPSAAVGPSDCVPINLLDPGGVRIDLTGTWREPGGGPVYYVYQDGSCVWYAGGFAASDGEQDWGKLGLFTVVYNGELKSDFTIGGRWAVVRMAGNSFAGNVWQDKTWAVTFEREGGDYVVVLTSPPDDSGAVSATRLEKLSDAVIEP